jgi:arsenite methyltransferase
MSTATQSVPGSCPTHLVDPGDIRAHVRALYSEVAAHPEADYHFPTGRALAERLGYPATWLAGVPVDALASFAGVGLALDLAALRPGERVLDLGSGSGTDAFIAANQVGPNGHVLGVDLTEAQVNKAQNMGDRHGTRQLRFARGDVERPPVTPGRLDAVVSNGVINLVPDKAAVFAAAAAALRPGGRLAVADIVSARPLAEHTRSNTGLWAACIAGAIPRAEYLAALETAGLRVETVRENPAYRFLSSRAAGAVRKYGVKSVSVLAVKIEPEGT